MEKPSYYSITPANVRYDSRLVMGAKMMYGEITALSNRTGECWATNDYFADLYSVNIRTIRRWITSLEKFGYITRILINQSKSAPDSVRHLKINTSGPVPEDAHKKVEELRDKRATMSSPPGQQCPPPQGNNALHNNTSINNTSTNKNRASNAAPDKKISKETQLKSDFEQLWQLYPLKRGKKDAFRHYKAAIKGGTVNDQIKLTITNYSKEISEQHMDPKYIMNGSTFFNKHPWEDEYYNEKKPDITQSPTHTNELQPQPIKEYDTSRKEVFRELWNECHDLDKVVTQVYQLCGINTSPEEVESYVRN